MLSVSTALARLQDGLGESFPDLPGTRIIDVAFPLNDAFDPLLWCGQQAQWPQFYWQQRNGDEELATLGAVKTFTSLDAANRFLRQVGRQDLRICGLNAFEPQQGSLALPRLEWRRCGGRAVLRLVLHSDISLREDAATARAFLASLTTTQATPGAIPPLLSERHSSDYPQWQAMIARATKAISAGEMDKVVLARATDLQFAAPLDAVSIMAASRRSNLNCFHFLMAFNARQAFFGSTPERLWRRRGALLRTEALAGTVANHQEDAKAQQLADWLMKDDKNQRENMLVVEDICQRLQSEASTLDVLPRRAALAFIQRHEPFSREWYAGSAGYLSLAQSEFCVALRSAKVNHDTLRLYAGAGIVSGSDAQQEWQEIDNKAAGLRSLLCP
ncbi:isochorismate synthase MenF [Klebsiella pneumoniae]|uniref:isochorismate synthase MenF n=1 Tax=Klebsiella pneumoniae TaxID=573 RepID=UPI000CF8F204|nr:isochorismate synthase MenF [Klebsiella pneumoniae]RNY21074.1 isochorismate synthase MenF [Klebsiella pneumoniae subsp. pneumoniae]